MALLTQELLSKKLKTWVLSSKIPSHLGFDESKGPEIKQELHALAEMGLVEETGQRRGLKFRFKSAANVSSSNTEEEEDPEVLSEEEVEKLPPMKISEAASLHAYFADRDLIKSETAGKTPLQMMSALTDIAIKDPSVLSHTLAYKKTSEGRIIVTFWQGCVKQYEKNYSLETFLKVINSELKALSKPKSA